jgi:hypothetical protein
VSVEERLRRLKGGFSKRRVFPHIGALLLAEPFAHFANDPLHNSAKQQGLQSSLALMNHAK